jgi:hypothetical protein
MTKLSLSPAPTFKAKVGIPVAGSKPADVEFTFRHHTTDEVKAWLKEEQPDVEAVMWCVAGWELEDTYDAENVARLLQGYLGAAAAIVSAYLSELRGARTKN